MSKIIKINKNKLINGLGGPLLLNSEIKIGKGSPSAVILEEEQQKMIGKGVVLKNNNNLKRKPLRLNI